MGDAVLIKALSTASVKLEFYTKGGKIEFEYKISPGTLREYYSIDLLIDGVYKYNISEDKNEALGTFSYEIPESENEKRVTVYFPSTAVIKIKNIVIPDDYTPHRREKTFLMLGDSKYQGYYPNHFQNTCVNILSDILDVQLINQSVGGVGFSKDYIDKLEFKPDYIIVGYGLNDWALRRIGKGEKADEFLRKLTDIFPETTVYFILPPDNNYLEKTRKNADLVSASGNNEENLSIEDVRQIYAKVAKKYQNIILINSKDFVPQYKECYYSDNVHLTDLGNLICGNMLANNIIKIQE